MMSTDKISTDKMSTDKMLNRQKKIKIFCFKYWKKVNTIFLKETFFWWGALPPGKKKIQALDTFFRIG